MAIAIKQGKEDDGGAELMRSRNLVGLARISAMETTMINKLRTRTIEVTATRSLLMLGQNRE